MNNILAPFFQKFTEKEQQYPYFQQESGTAHTP
jgi:hypothetical protein